MTDSEGGCISHASDIVRRSAYSDGSPRWESQVNLHRCTLICIQRWKILYFKQWESLIWPLSVDIFLMTVSYGLHQSRGGKPALLSVETSPSDYWSAQRTPREQGSWETTIKTKHHINYNVAFFNNLSLRKPVLILKIQSHTDYNLI